MKTLDLLMAASGGKAIITECEAGKLLGGVSLKRLRNLRSEGKELIPTIQIGGRRFVCINDLATFVDRQRSVAMMASSTGASLGKPDPANPSRRPRGRPKLSSRK
jgi:hypothetical protein